MTLRNWRSASSIPAAVHRSPISPEDQFLTLRCVVRTMSIIDSHGFVDSKVRRSLPRIRPARVSRTNPQRTLLRDADLATSRAVATCEVETRFCVRTCTGGGEARYGFPTGFCPQAAADGAITSAKIVAHPVVSGTLWHGRRFRLPGSDTHVGGCTSLCTGRAGPRTARPAGRGSQGPAFCQGDICDCAACVSHACAALMNAGVCLSKPMAEVPLSGRFGTPCERMQLSSLIRAAWRRSLGTALVRASAGPAPANAVLHAFTAAMYVGACLSIVPTVGAVPFPVGSGKLGTPWERMHAASLTAAASAVEDDVLCGLFAEPQAAMASAALTAISMISSF